MLWHNRPIGPIGPILLKFMVALIIIFELGFLNSVAAAESVANSPAVNIEQKTQFTRVITEKSHKSRSARQIANINPSILGTNTVGSRPAPIVSDVPGNDNLQALSTKNQADHPDLQESQSSRLFFVALGFAVLFANIWILIGLRYCFNDRHRRHLADIEGQIETIRMHDTPGRRRTTKRKRVLTQAQIDEKFPSLKYIEWKRKRSEIGLSAQGGVDKRHSNMPQLVACLNREREEHAEDHTDSVYSDEENVEQFYSVRDSLHARSASGSSSRNDTVDAEKNAAKENRQEADSTPKVPAKKSEAEPTESNKLTAPAAQQDSHENEAGKASQVETLEMAEGDTCAICIDEISDSDIVRALSCSHVFHADCIDRWLKTFQANCPLCKTDFYVLFHASEAAETLQVPERAVRRTHPLIITTLFLGPSEQLAQANRQRNNRAAAQQSTCQ